MVYRQSVRTNNDVEGWYHRINKKAQKPNLQMYILIILLHKEAKLLPTQLKMVTEGKLRRYQRKKTKELQHRIFALWGKYSEEEITVNHLLKKCCKIYGGQ
jgi:ferredoxin-fold anticodon binding domain-containing protein